MLKYKYPKNRSTFDLHQPVYGKEQTHILHRSIDGCQDDKEQHQSRTGHTGWAHGGCRGGQQNSQELTKTEYHATHLGHKDGGNSYEEGGAIHVDVATDGKDEARDARIDAQLVVHAAECDWQRGGAAEDVHGVCVCMGKSRCVREYVCVWWKSKELNFHKNNKGS